MKYIILAIIIYFAYRNLIRPALTAPEEKTFIPPAEKKADQEGEYTDYEEVS